MNQYERIVSYIYQYEKEQKGANVGYAKLEKRGNQCRISVQMRAVAMQETPKVYLYKQMEEGIQTIFAGQLQLRGNSMLWKENCMSDKLFGTDWCIEEVDGIFLDGTAINYFATTWKNDRFYRGNWNGDSMIVEKNEDTKQEVLETKAETESAAPEKEEKTIENNESEMDMAVAETKNISAEEVEKAALEKKVEVEKEEKYGKQTQETEVQMQSICGVCPFKRKNYDYGKKILMSFPSMKPFEKGVARACVRMELQDIGCLPIASWSLSGNRFLLHGYYCYRHLLFAQLQDGRYVLGVPGIYSEKEQRNALRFGFSDFQSIGDFGMKQGVFGYWFLELPGEHSIRLS